ncbi:MAG: lactate/malate family dehydrogenase [Pyrinomonadaceae bacterium]
MKESIDQRTAVNRVAIVGCENVEPASAYSLLLNRSIDELLLLGRGGRALRRAVQAICDQYAPPRPARLRLGSFRDLAAARILIVASGVARETGEAADDTLRREYRSVSRLMQRVRSSGFSGIVLMTTEPVDLMTQTAQRLLGSSPERVIGIGSTLARPRPADQPERRRDLPVAVWCSARVADNQQMDACEPDCPYFEDVLAQARNGQERRRRRAGSLDIAACVMRACEAILDDEKAVFPVSALARGEYGISGVYLNLPCVIGKGGAERVLELPATDEMLRQMLDKARYVGRMNIELQKHPRGRPRHSFKIGPDAGRAASRTIT